MNNRNSSALVSGGNKVLVEKIRELLHTQGRASLADLGGHAVADQIRLLQSLNIVDRMGDHLFLVEAPHLGRRNWPIVTEAA